MNWKQPKQLSKTTLPFGRSLNGHGRTSASLRLCVKANSARRSGKPNQQQTNNKQEESK